MWRKYFVREVGPASWLFARHRNARQLTPCCVLAMCPLSLARSLPHSDHRLSDVALHTPLEPPIPSLPPPTLLSFFPVTSSSFC